MSCQLLPSFLFISCRRLSPLPCRWRSPRSCCCARALTRGGSGWRKFRWRCPATIPEHPRSHLEFVSGLENPPHRYHTQGKKTERRRQADVDADIRAAEETTAKAADQVQHRVEQRHLLPQRREHVDRI